MNLLQRISSSLDALTRPPRPFSDLQAELIEERTKRIFAESVLADLGRRRRERRKDCKAIRDAKAATTRKLKVELGRAPETCLTRISRSVTGEPAIHLGLP